MPDRRLTPANSRVAATRLRGIVNAPQYTDGTPRRIAAPVVDLLASPGGARDRQLLLGAGVTVYDLHAGYAFIQAHGDGYVGYVSKAALTAEDAPTHRVVTRATHAYAEPDMKSRDVLMLPMAATVTVTAQANRFSQTPEGFIPTQHLTPVETIQANPITVATRLLGTPYLWGGNSSLGIDCSGLVQIACMACGVPCPGDSDMQERSLGQTLPPDTPPQSGDLLFWKGHVAWVMDPQTLLHANAFHMAVTFEPLQDAVTRITAQGDGPVTRHARLI